jgi:competence protein ComEA
MLTTAEKQSLAITLCFLLIGGGLKAWRQAKVRLGPFEDHAATAGQAFPDAPGAPIPPGSSGYSGAPPLAGAAGDSQPVSAHHSHPADPRADAAPGKPGGSPELPPLPGTGAFPEPANGAGSDIPGTGAARMPRKETMPAVLDKADPWERTSSPSRRSGGRKAAPAGKVPLDRATAAELALVPGIGPKTAQAIVDYRAAHGPFRNMRELLNVKGIGEKKLERIRPCLVLSPAGGME